jgi:hypothetical protein
MYVWYNTKQYFFYSKKSALNITVSSVLIVHKNKFKKSHFLFLYILLLEKPKKSKKYFFLSYGKTYVLLLDQICFIINTK